MGRIIRKKQHLQQTQSTVRNFRTGRVFRISFISRIFFSLSFAWLILGFLFYDKLFPENVIIRTTTNPMIRTNSIEVHTTIERSSTKDIPKEVKEGESVLVVEESKTHDVVTTANSATKPETTEDAKTNDLIEGILDVKDGMTNVVEQAKTDTTTKTESNSELPLTMEKESTFMKSETKKVVDQTNDQSEVFAERKEDGSVVITLKEAITNTTVPKLKSEAYKTTEEESTVSQIDTKKAVKTDDQTEEGTTITHVDEAKPNITEIESMSELPQTAQQQSTVSKALDASKEVKTNDQIEGFPDTKEGESTIPNAKKAIENTNKTESKGESLQAIPEKSAVLKSNTTEEMKTDDLTEGIPKTKESESAITDTEEGKTKTTETISTSKSPQTAGEGSTGSNSETTKDVNANHHIESVPEAKEDKSAISNVEEDRTNTTDPISMRKSPQTIAITNVHEVITNITDTNFTSDLPKVAEEESTGSKSNTTKDVETNHRTEGISEEKDGESTIMDAEEDKTNTTETKLTSKIPQTTEEELIGSKSNTTKDIETNNRTEGIPGTKEGESIITDAEEAKTNVTTETKSMYEIPQTTGGESTDSISETTKGVKTNYQIESILGTKEGESITTDVEEAKTNTTTKTKPMSEIPQSTEEESTVLKSNSTKDIQTDDQASEVTMKTTESNDLTSLEIMHQYDPSFVKSKNKTNITIVISILCNDDNTLPTHIETLYNSTDRFFIIETSHNHSGVKNVKDFEAFKNKIHWVTFEVKDEHLKKSAWEREDVIRQASIEVIRDEVAKGTLQHPFLVINVDSDEIVDPDDILKMQPNNVYFEKVMNRPIFFEMKLFKFNLNWLIAQETWRKAHVVPGHMWIDEDPDIRQFIQHLRTNNKMMNNLTNVISSGYHLSFFLPVASINKKIKTFYRKELNRQSQMSEADIRKVISTGGDPFRPNHFSTVFTKWDYKQAPKVLQEYHLKVCESQQLDPETSIVLHVEENDA